MRVLRAVFSRLHIYVLWLIVSTVFWGWIFLWLTDTAPSGKVTVYIDAPCDDRALELALEETLPAGIRMIKVHPFSYAMFDDGDLERADLYLVPESRASNYISSYLPLPDALADSGVPVWRHGGQAYGLAAGGALMEHIRPEDPDEAVFLFFGARSPHAASLTGAGDDAALAVAGRFTGVPGTS